MAARRSKSVGGEHRPKHPRRLKYQTVSQLKSLYDRDNLRRTSVAPIIQDLRGNAMACNSFGHIHHPYNLSTSSRLARLVELPLSTSWRWARLVELLLQSDGQNRAEWWHPPMVVNSLNPTSEEEEDNGWLVVQDNVNTN